MSAFENGNVIGKNGIIYYVDSVIGNDCNDGQSEHSPWRSLQKINQTVFGPGDRILLKAGCRFEGQLNPSGSGTQDAPIQISRYGLGNNPIIDGVGREGVRTQIDNTGAVVLLQNQDYWEISNLEIINQSETMGKRFGILVRWHDYGTGHHVYIHDCYIHDISGMYEDGAEEQEEDGTIKSKHRFLGDGILVIATGTPEQEGGIPTNFDDIRIECNRLENIWRTGITIWSQWTDRPGAPLYYPKDQKRTFHDTVGRFVANTNVVIRKNVLDKIAGDGILVNTCDGALIEYNRVGNCNLCSVKDPNAAIWPHNSDYTVMQFNEVYGTRSTYDGQSFDVDMNCMHTIIQNNFSHDNEGGFLLIMHDAKDVIVRYNISENDKTALFDWRGHGVRVYNNTFYTSAPVHRNGGGSGSLMNNIFCTAKLVENPSWGEFEYSHNCYYGFVDIPKDMQPIVGDPGLQMPGSQVPEGYRLSAGSPCIGAGLPVCDDDLQTAENFKCRDIGAVSAR